MSDDVTNALTALALGLAAAALVALLRYGWSYSRWANRSAAAAGQRAAQVANHLSAARQAAARGDLVGHAAELEQAVTATARPLPNPPGHWLLVSALLAACAATGALAAADGGWDVLARFLGGDG